jgi:BioD-like phosphotransacetylase family protein
MKDLREIGVPVTGVIPYKEQLTHFTVSYLAEKLYARVIAGEAGMGNIVKNIFVGAMSTDESMRNPLFNKENKLLITSGDRSDMILAALDGETMGILLTNNILPPSNIVSKAAEKNVPLLMVTADTYHVTRQIDGMEALLTRDNRERIGLLAQLTEKYIYLDTLLA